MSQDFKSQLEAFVNEAAKRHSKDISFNEYSYIGNHFKQGCEFLIPVLMRAIEQRDHFIALYDDFAKQERNKELLNILKGEGK